eukprot:273508-Hanusia_phi.AAC.2
MSKDREIAFGRSQYNRFLMHGTVLPPNDPAAQLVARVGTRVAQATDPNLPWEFKVIRSPQVNAACLPGGKVVVFEGLLQTFNYDEHALAAVLAHEAGHVLARYSFELLVSSVERAHCLHDLALVHFYHLMLLLASLMWLDFFSSMLFNARFITNWVFVLGAELPYSRQAPSYPSSTCT